MQYHPLVWHLVQQVVEKALPDETPPARLKQVAILLTVEAMNQRMERVTTADVGSVFKLTPAQMGQILHPLVQKGLIERQKVVNRQGRGHAFALKVRETPELKALMNELADES